MPRDYSCQNVEGDKGRQNHRKPSGAEAGMHLDVGGVFSSTAGEKLGGKEGRRCCKVLQGIIETLDPFLCLMETVGGF